MSRVKSFLAGVVFVCLLIVGAMAGALFVLAYFAIALVLLPLCLCPLAWRRRRRCGGRELSEQERRIFQTGLRAAIH